MNKNKETFVRPFCENLDAELEGIICESTLLDAGGSFSTPSAGIEDDSDQNWGW